MSLNMNEIDQAFPIIVRYVGLMTTLILIGFCLDGFYLQAAPGFVAASGMILYKNIHDAARDSIDDTEAKESMVHEETAP